MLVRRAARSAALLTVPATALLAAPANAGIPVGWAEPTDVDPLHYAMLLVFAPIGLALLITVLSLAPALARGQRLLEATGTLPWSSRASIRPTPILSRAVKE